MTMPPLPKPDTHCWDDDTGKDVWSHSPDQMRAYGEACAAAERERTPLTDEQIDAVTREQWSPLTPMYAAHRAFARAIERMHGIKETP